MNKKHRIDLRVNEGQWYRYKRVGGIRWLREMLVDESENRFIACTKQEADLFTSTASANNFKITLRLDEAEFILWCLKGGAEWFKKVLGQPTIYVLGTSYLSAVGPVPTPPTENARQHGELNASQSMDSLTVTPPYFDYVHLDPVLFAATHGSSPAKAPIGELYITDGFLYEPPKLSEVLHADTTAPQDVNPAPDYALRIAKEKRKTEVIEIVTALIVFAATLAAVIIAVAKGKHWL